MSDQQLHLSLINNRVEVARLTAAVDAFARANGISDDDLHNIHLILDELVINVIKYAYADTRPHTIDVRLGLQGTLLTIVIEDDGRPYDPTARPAPNLDLPIEQRPIGGLGVHIVKTLSDSFVYRRVDDRNVVTVTRTIRRVPPA